MPELVKHPWQVRNAAVSSSKGPVASFLTDFGMSVEDAAHFPRVDVSGTDEITIMNHIPSVLINSIKRRHKNVTVAPNGVSPNLVALPQLIKRETSGDASGTCFITSPHASVVSKS